MNQAHPVAIVTGGSSGIGEKIVSLLKENAYRVANFDLQPPFSGQPTQPVQQEQETDSLYFQGDVTKQTDLDELIAQVEKRWQQIDILINCAGIYPSVHLDEYTDELWDACLAVNVTGPYRLIQRVVPIMKRGQRGYIVNVTSGAAYLGSRDPGYSASKSALAGLTKSLAKNLSKHNITVNAVAPGPIDTPMSQKGMRPDDVQQYVRSIPLSRFGEPQEVAEAVLFLVSGKADYITGSTIHINGGLFLN